MELATIFSQGNTIRRTSDRLHKKVGCVILIMEQRMQTFRMNSTENVNSYIVLFMFVF